MSISEDKVETFAKPTALPETEAQNRDWQERNRRWWESRPMRYDFDQPIDAEPGTEKFFAAIDERFIEQSRVYMPWRSRPFDQLIDYDALRRQDVLEIGVGFGTHAQLLATHAKSFTGIDLTEAASSMTRKRFEVRQLPGKILRMDAEKLDFPDASFDHIWSWGVIHHSANTLQIVREMNRVLRPGGTATVMVYHRSFWRWYVVNGFFRGIIYRRFGKESLHTITQKATDGAIARFYTPEEFAEMCRGLFDVTGVKVYGMPEMSLPLPNGRVKKAVIRAVPDAAWRVLTNTLRTGTFLCLELRKR